MLIVVALSLGAALLLAVSTAVQQRAAARSTFAHQSRALPGVGLLGELIRQPLWLVGWVANIGGFLVHSAALHLGSVTQVQPLMVTQLLFALPLGFVGTERRLSAGGWIGAAAICAGLAALFIVGGDLPPTEGLDPSSLVAVFLVTVGAAVGLVTAVGGRGPAARTAVFGVAAGLFVALRAVLTKETATQFVADGVWAAATTWCGYGLVSVAFMGLLLTQTAFASGPLAPAVTAINITNPAASMVLAAVVYGSAWPDWPGEAANLALAGVLVTGGVVALARGLSVDAPRSAP